MTHEIDPISDYGLCIEYSMLKCRYILEQNITDWVSQMINTYIHEIDVPLFSRQSRTSVFLKRRSFINDLYAFTQVYL